MCVCGFGALALPQQELSRGSLGLGWRAGDLADAGSDLQRWQSGKLLVRGGGGGESQPLLPAQMGAVEPRPTTGSGNRTATAPPLPGDEVSTQPDPVPMRDPSSLRPITYLIIDNC